MFVIYNMQALYISNSVKLNGLWIKCGLALQPIIEDNDNIKYYLAFGQVLRVL